MWRTKRHERPWTRSIVKLLTTVVFGRARAHYHSWLPFLSIAGRNAAYAGRVRYRGKAVVDLKSAAELSAVCGNAIYVIGSGPSIAQQDLSSIPPRSALLLNGAIALIGREINVPLAIVIEDERFVWRHFAMMKDKIAQQHVCLFSTGVLRAICEIDGDWLVGRSIILVDDIRKPYARVRQSATALADLDHVHLSLDGDVGFSFAPDKGVFQGGSVVISALQFACAMPSSTIGLLGIDISNAETPRFYETDAQIAYSGVAEAESRILAHVQLALLAVEPRGIQVRNHSPVSALQKIGMAYTPLSP